MAYRLKRFRESIRPYIELMRLHKPVGIYLLLWPSWWGIILASHEMLQALPLLLLFLIGAVVMRSAGCVVNDLWDMRIDREVLRTKTRPLASGRLSVLQALLLLGVLLIFGLFILFQLNLYTIGLGIIFVGMVIIYPLMKRVMFIPQAFLGLTMNAGVLMGYSAIAGHITLATGWLYAAAFFWTIGYDTIYAYQDKEDDIKIGVKSSAIAFGSQGKIMVALCYAASLMAFVMVGYVMQLSWLYHLGLVAVLLHFGWQVYRVNLHDPSSCIQHFRSNIGLGAWLFLVLLVTG